MKKFIDQLVFLLFRIFACFIKIFSYATQIYIVENLLRFTTFLIPRYRKIGIRNLELAFPDISEELRHKILRRSHRSLARLIVDFLRMNTFGQKEASLEVEFPMKDRLLQLVGQGKSVVFATGHLGSFELLAHYLALIGVPLAFVARPIRPPQLDVWWTAKREAHGNSVIPRDGALKGTLRYLKNGKAVGVLFDQNITRQHAVFVDWFGRQAATSKLVGIAAVRTSAPVVVISIQSTGLRRYRVNAVECDFEAIYADSSLSTDEKILEITRKVSSEYVEMIRANPEEWFWMHRRWKTAPQEEPEDFYTLKI